MTTAATSGLELLDNTVSCCRSELYLELPKVMQEHSTVPTAWLSRLEPRDSFLVVHKPRVHGDRIVGEYIRKVLSTNRFEILYVFTH